MSSYLVTGGAGFIGSHLANRLQKQGHKVIVIDDLSSGKKSNLNSGIDVITKSICDTPIINKLINSVDGCFHLAAIPSVPKCHSEWLKSHETNVSGTINILEAAKSKKTPIVYASSSSVYGDNEELPSTEKAKTIPLSAYAADKLGCEYHAAIASKIFGIPTIGLRFFNVYGPNQDPNSPYSGVISIFLNNALENKPVTIFGDGEQTRDFIYVSDIVDGLVSAMLHCDTSAGVYNLCTGQPHSLLQLQKIIEQLTHNTVSVEFAPPRPGDIKHSYGSPKKAQKYFEFQINETLESGLEKLIAYFKKYGHS